MTTPVDKVKQYHDFIMSRIELMEGSAPDSKEFQSNLAAIKNGANKMVLVIEDYQEEEGLDDSYDDAHDIDELDVDKLNFADGNDYDGDEENF